jgi:hypothetical protein
MDFIAAAEVILYCEDDVLFLIGMQ